MRLLKTIVANTVFEIIKSTCPNVALTYCEVKCVFFLFGLQADCSVHEESLFIDTVFWLH